MPRYNKTTAKPVVKGPVTAQRDPAAFTYEGAPGYARDVKSDLFLLAVSHLGDGSFYESQDERDQRLRALAHRVAVQDPEWTVKFVRFLRDTANMRTAAVVTAAEAAKGLLEAGVPGGRQIVAGALKRADEPGELLAYWTSRYGRNIPKPVKRGIADAAQRLYSEYSLLKYDTASHGYRFADVLDLTHPGTRGPWQGELYKHALDRRHNRGDIAEISPLPMIAAQQYLRVRAAEDPRALLDPEVLNRAGMTWEDALSLAGDRVPKKELWEALIPSMGYMALLRNLRNFDQAGISDEIAALAGQRLADPEQVSKSRQFPFRFLAAHRAVPSFRWAHYLEKALNASLANIPELKGRTLILVDRSGSMYGPVSAKSGLNFADTAALFGTALALRGEHADLVQFGTASARVEFSPADPVLRVMDRFGSMGGTQTADAVRTHYRGQSRVVILTDEQAWGGWYGADPMAQFPDSVPGYTWNLAGYRHGHGPAGEGNRFALGGLTDTSFKVIQLLEAGRDGNWDDIFQS